MLVEEILLGSGGSHDSFEVLDSFLFIIEDGESFLVVLLLLPLVTALLQFLCEETIVKVVVLASSLGLFLLLLSKSVHSPDLVLLAECSVLVGQDSGSGLPLEEADLRHASEGICDGEVELEDDRLALGDLNGFGVGLLTPI